MDNKIELLIEFNIEGEIDDALESRLLNMVADVVCLKLDSSFDFDEVESTEFSILDNT